jgi:hypothetical protein
MKKKDALVGYYFNNNLMHSIKGDKSLRESVYNRERAFNSVDENLEQLSQVWFLITLMQRLLPLQRKHTKHFIIFKHLINAFNQLTFFL